MIVILPAGAVELIEWNIIEIPQTGTRHFVGFSIYDKFGRVSTPIVEFDEVTFLGKTQSGSEYLLKGAPGKVHDDALYVLESQLAPFSIDYNWVYPFVVK